MEAFILIFIVALIFIYVIFISPELKNMKMIRITTEKMTPNQALAFKFFAERIGWFGKKYLGRKRTTWKEYNHVLQKQIKDICSIERAFDKLGICATDLTVTEPVLLQGFEYVHAMAYVNEYKSESICAKEVVFPTSKKWVSDTYEIAYIVFSPKQLFLYTCRFSTIKTEMRETTCEFFYQDITSLATHPKTIEFRTNHAFESFETEVFSVVVPGAEINAAINGTLNHEEAVNSMKTLLREKKGELSLGKDSV